MDQLKVQRFVIAGNSLGGEVAWRTALMAPQRVGKLILVDAAGPDFKSDSVPIGFMLARVPGLHRIVDWVLPRAMVESSVRNVYGDPSRVDAALVDRYYQLALREGNRRALVQRFQQNQRGQDAGRIRELKLPTLILWGGRDRLVPLAVAQQFQQDIAGSELVVFDELGPCAAGGRSGAQRGAGEGLPAAPVTPAQPAAALQDRVQRPQYLGAESRRYRTPITPALAASIAHGETNQDKPRRTCSTRAGRR